MHSRPAGQPTSWAQGGRLLQPAVRTQAATRKVPGMNPGDLPYPRRAASSILRSLNDGDGLCHLVEHGVLAWACTSTGSINRPCLSCDPLSRTSDLRRHLSPRKESDARTTRAGVPSACRSTAREKDQPIAQLAKSLGISESCLRNGLAQADRDEGKREGLTREERRAPGPPVLAQNIGPWVYPVRDRYASPRRRSRGRPAARSGPGRPCRGCARARRAGAGRFTFCWTIACSTLDGNAQATRVSP